MNTSNKNRFRKNFNIQKKLETSSSKECIGLTVIGGGAAGFMAAITAAESGVTSVKVLESTSQILEKVRISGGGRCNVTHACWDPNELIVNYPRGEKALRGAFSRFATGDAKAWFEEKGLELIIEKDGRIFPKSNSSNEVIKCLKNAALRAGVNYSTQMEVMEILYIDHKEGFKIKCRNNKVLYTKKVLLATGGKANGKKIAKQLGHEIVNSVPSLFTFKLTAQWLKACSGIAIDKVSLRLKINKKVYEQSGRILITHWGLSGPAVLKLSAFAARDLYNYKYKALLTINWSDYDIYQARELLLGCRREFKSKSLKNLNPFKNIPNRIWLSILKSINISPATKWSTLSKKDLHYLCEAITNNNHSIIGKGPFGEEFVTAGGIDLKDICFKSMESRKCEGLYFAGEIINVDGVTGGFNFQHCWTSGWLAGKAIAKVLSPPEKNQN